jgi:HSP20 family protein
MSLIRWNPTRDLMNWPSDLFGLQRDMNRIFDNFFRGATLEDNGIASFWSPAVDIAEEDDAYLVKVELPGVSKDDVKITLESNVLTICGEKKEDKEIKEKNIQRMERTYGAFQRSFMLPTSVKGEKIDAVYNDGVLTITVPKAEESKLKQIAVKVR